ncbi:hypothetical protein [Pseudoduganella armeniaca]|uniref:Transporter substrate-binding domain-containing protein n=1 Tax=Pseudoduganella armeniaca TaxID=2072590 RepID=A0A2R4CG29_9BURK|nr:hypothetical protein [Pseudoduganella armeniaca]AVR98589.1 hypothetical protein C9I28_25365 [Pseudoduganella armeniaca]
MDIHWQPLAVTDWQAANLRKLRAGRLDAVFFENEYSPRYYARQEGVPIRLVRLPMPERTFFMAYSLKADRADVARFNRVAAAAFANDQFRQFLDRYTALERLSAGAYRRDTVRLAFCCCRPAARTGLLNASRHGSRPSRRDPSPRGRLQ